MGIEDEVQLVVMQRVLDWGRVDIDAVRERYPKVDGRDLLHCTSCLGTG